jgi:hypothetical protein
MIAFYGETPIPAVAVRGQRLVEIGRWPELLARAADMSAVVVRAGELDAGARDRLRELRRAAPLTPVVLVAPTDREAARHLGAVVVDRVVWEDELPEGLSIALQEANEASALLARLIEAVEGADGMAPHFRRKLLTALEADPPFRTVKRWARELGVTTRAIQEAWSDHYGKKYRPHDFLGFVRSLRTLGSREHARISAMILREIEGLATHDQAGTGGAC